MQAAALIPAPDAIPVSAGWLEGLLIVTFAVHILLVNAVLGGAVVCTVRSIVSRNSVPVKTVGKLLPSLFALAVNFGVAPLLFIQMLYGQYLYSSSVLMAVYWLSIVFLAIAAYYALYVFVGKYGAHKKLSFSIMISTLAMLCIGFIMSNNMTLMLRPDVWAAYFDNPDGTLLNLNDATVLLRYLHVVVASIAVGGLVLALVARYKMSADNPAIAEQEERLGLSIFLTASLAQLLFGVALFFSLPEQVRMLFTGGSEFYTGSILIALSAVALLFYQAGARNLHGTVGALVLTVLIMTGIRALVRKAMLDPYGGVAAIPVQAEYSPFIVFLIALAFGLAAISYMVKLAFSSKGDE